MPLSGTFGLLVPAPETGVLLPVLPVCEVGVVAWVLAVGDAAVVVGLPHAASSSAKAVKRKQGSNA